MYLEEALENGAKLKTVQGEVIVESRLIGELYLPTGRVVACDPFLVYDTEPFDQEVEPGKYPLTLSIAHYEEGDQRIALATIHFREEKPKSWTTATTSTPGSRRYRTRGNVTTVEGIYNYIVDYGCGSFMDAQAAVFLTERLRADPDYMYGLAEQMRENLAPTREWAIVTLEPNTGLNLGIFSSGGGDGDYYSYWGIAGDDEDDEIVCLTTDFEIFAEDSPEIEGDDSDTITLWAR